MSIKISKKDLFPDYRGLVQILDDLGIATVTKTKEGYIVFYTDATKEFMEILDDKD